MTNEEQKLHEITHLSRNAIRDICDMDKQDQVKTKSFYIQVNEVKIFTEQDNKKNIRQRYSHFPFLEETYHIYSL